MTKLTTASVLAFERNLDISDAVFSQYNSEDNAQTESFVAVRTKSVRGTISNRLKNNVANDPAKLDAEIQKANLQTVDVAMLDNSNNMLKVGFTCKVLPFNGTPSVCNNQPYQSKLTDVVGEYLEENGVEELAKRYAANILNARWLWRNRIGSESVVVTVRCNVDGEEQVVSIANARQLSLNNFDGNSEQLTTVAGWIASGLRGDSFIMMQVEAKAHMGFGQEVYPSQELVLDTGKTKSKELYVVNENTRQAGMHSQKISNAIRTIDTWYSDDAAMPIAIEPYGAVTTLGTAFRQPKAKMDFYSLFDSWVLKDKKPAVEQQHYVMAILIRGGVFGESGKE
ncbi:type I-F CRISPR-associated protein Csy3 [Sansalvadorimonas verongulae]|uniref:type I-F CRISPR-associated protein Csy3 n=1 Tax=Sansalvadorimonas verongulae TaxID=2172824 RepID=UPI0012BC5E37|nr:type I-F CRISPR-associated protein Csy3 [Sansalvadorimonas verongulae]MTI12679.1 type I-F CRISPR-associated protein Csy3 [Sansalvadorimonas verongulae]